MASRGRRREADGRRAGSDIRRRQERTLTAAALLILILGVAQLAAPAVSQALSQLSTTPAVPTALATPATTATGAVIPPSTGARSAPTQLPAPPKHRTTTTVAGRKAGAPPSTHPPLSAPASTLAPVTAPPIKVTTPNGYGCEAALAYLAANQAPGFVDVCAPQSAGPGAAGKTAADVTTSGTTGTIYISCPAPIVYQNEASNSWKFSGVSSLPLDPWGGVPWSQCRTGDIAPRN